MTLLDELPPMTKEESAEYDRIFTASAWEGRAEYDAEWRSQRFAVGWVEPKPTYLSFRHWDVWAVPDPDRACIRTIRFSLLGGGQIRLQEMFCDPRFRPGICWDLDNPEYDKTFRYGHRLLIKAETPGGLRQVAGRIDSFYYEMSMTAVLVPARDQDIADRAAATFRLMVNENGMPGDVDTFTALLDGSEGCAFCNRALKDPVSKLIGYGPDCAKQHGLAHTNEAANAVLAKRRELGL